MGLWIKVEGWYINLENVSWIEVRNFDNPPTPNRWYLFVGMSGYNRTMGLTAEEAVYWQKKLSEIIETCN